MSEEKKEYEQQNVAQETVCYSGFWVRGAANIIDGFIVSILSMFIIVPIGIYIGFSFAFLDSPFVNFFVQGIAIFVSFILTWAYCIFMIHKYQATLGKMAIGAKVVSENGERLSLGKIVIRETIGKFVSGFIFGIGYIMVAFTKKKQGLHDMMAQSIVVYKDAKKGANKIVVGIVYAIYGLMIFAFITMITVVMIILGVAVSTATNIDDMPGYVDEFSGSVEEIENSISDW